MEEISPVLDVIPTFTLMWIYTNFIDPEEVQNEVDEKEKLP